MAQYYTDFSEYDLGSFTTANSDWTVEGNASIIESAGSVFGGRCLQSLQSNFFALWDAAETDTQLEVAFRAYYPDNASAHSGTTATHACAVTRFSNTTTYTGSGPAQTDTNTELRLRNRTGSAVDGNNTGALVAAWCPGWFNFSLRHYGTESLESFAWLDGQEDQKVFGRNYTNAAFSNSAGKAGVMNRFVSVGFLWDWVGIGTNGDPAPRPSTGSVIRTSLGYLRTGSGILRPA